jgi:hypothetical protein
MAQNRLKSHRIRVDYAAYERQLFPKAAVQPSTWQANANVALGSKANVEWLSRKRYEEEAVNCILQSYY